MSHLIERFKEDLQLSGYAQRSIQSYISSVLPLQRFYNKPLEEITEEELRRYCLCCQSEFGWSAATLRISYSGIGHLFKRDFQRRLKTRYSTVGNVCIIWAARCRTEPSFIWYPQAASI